MGEISEISLRVQIRVGTYIYRYILYSVNLRFPPGFEDGHFHGFSSGGTKILMNHTNTVRRKKWRQTSCCFPCVLWVPIGVEVDVSGQSLSFGIWSWSLQYLIDSDYALESPSTSCKFAIISGCTCNLTMPISCYIPFHIVKPFPKTMSLKCVFQALFCYCMVWWRY